MKMRTMVFQMVAFGVIFNPTNLFAVVQGKESRPMTPEVTKKAIDFGDGLSIRIIEIPKVKMVRSGNSDLGKFDKWWMSISAKDTYSIFPRDFMWHNPKYNKEEWLYAIPPGTSDYGGYDTLNFVGGLYAVASCKESDLGKTSARVRNWLKNSELFVLDEQTVDRYDMVHIITPKSVREKVGFNQMDFFFPIKFR